MLTHAGFFSENRSALIYEKEQQSGKIIHDRAKKFTFLRRFDRRSTIFLDIEKSISKRLFSNDSKCKTITVGQLIKDKTRL